ncbi:hypothetical protein PARMER_02599 [Parabacteroides merdae ATCC 43184]|nr:hypothetical protein PARMER_02599 [Parabacteroides merdae ATCC 43184]
MIIGCRINQVTENLLDGAILRISPLCDNLYRQAT